MIESPFYIQHLSEDVNSYELKKFRVQYDEVQLVKYLVKKAKTHEKDKLLSFVLRLLPCHIMILVNHS